MQTIKWKRVRQASIKEIYSLPDTKIVWKGIAFALPVKDIPEKTYGHYLLICLSRTGTLYDNRVTIGRRAKIESVANGFIAITMSGPVDSYDCAYWPLNEVVDLLTLQPG